MLRINKANSILKVLAIFFVSGLFYFFPQTVSAATLYLRPSATNVKVGATFTVKALVNTQGKVINNAEAAIVFPSDLVEVVSVNSNSSVFSLWVERPTFSNPSSVISFNGGVPNPGYNGSGGEILTATLKAKKNGTANLYFTGPSIRENDGLGTDIYSGQSGTSIIIGGAPTEEPPKTESTDTGIKKLSAPSISSLVFSDQNAWYNVNSGVVSFRIPSGVTAVQTGLDNSQYGQPSVLFRSPITSRELKDVGNGIWYFHVRYQSGGQWSPVGNYRIQIDKEPPKNLTAQSFSDSEGSKIKINAQDDFSGIDHYEVYVNNLEALTINAADSANPILLSGLAVGDNEVKILAYDKAKNKSEISLSIKSEKLPAPSITDYSEVVVVGDSLHLKGSSIPDSKLAIIVKQSGDSPQIYQVNSDGQGNFDFTSDSVPDAGNYQVWAYITDDSGPISYESNKVTIKAETKKWSIDFSGLTGVIYQIPYSSILPWLLLIFLALYGWYKFWKTRRKLAIANRRADEAFMMLIDNAIKQTSILDKLSKKRKITRSEALALNELQTSLEKIKELKDQEMK